MLPVRIAVDDVWIGQPLGPAVVEQVDGELRTVELGRAAVQRALVPRLTGATGRVADPRNVRQAGDRNGMP